MDRIPGPGDGVRACFVALCTLYPHLLGVPWKVMLYYRNLWLFSLDLSVCCSPREALSHAPYFLCPLI